MKRVKGHRYLYRRGEYLVFRRGVPKRARAAFGKIEVLVSLRTGSISEARHILARELEKFDRLLADATGTRSPAAVLDPIKREPTAEEAEEGVRLWFAERVGHLVEELGTITDEGRAVDLMRDYDALSEDAATGMRIGSESTMMSDWIVEALIERFGWQIAPSTPLHRRLTKLVGRGQIEAARRFAQEAKGEPRRVLDETFSPEQYRLDVERQRERVARSPVSMMGLFDGYAKERKPAAATIKAWRRQLSAFVAFVGHDDAAKVTPEDVVSWKDHLLHKAGKNGSGLSAKTVGETYLSALKTTFRWAVENRKLPINPAETTRVRGAKKVRKREQGLTDEEATLILKATFAPPPPRLSPERALARRWVPWICAYTGARVNEITQLRAKDIAQISGIWTIHITPDAGSVKTSARTVAMHSHLIEQGLPRLAKAAKGYLFFNPENHRGGSDGNPQSKKVGEHLAKWVREIGVNDPNVQPNHGWRHRFKTIGRNVRMDPETRDRIQGHAPRTEGENYGDVSPAAMRREIELIPRYIVGDQLTED